MEAYVGLDRKHIAHMNRQRSRACTIFKNYPQCHLLQNEIGLLDLDHDDEQQQERACFFGTPLTIGNIIRFSVPCELAAARCA
ncbi:MAG: hypothetical protein ACKPKO_35280, partial [Candidatus Fonsibacter sp.]